MSPSAEGSVKVEICQRLGDDWRKLIDYFQIPPYDEAEFERGHECREIWAWLENRARLDELPAGLRFIKRADLADLLTQRQRESADHYYQDCLTRWSAPQYALDKRFVHLTLLLDQGEEAQGPRWQSSERFQDLGEVLAKVPDPALVLLGPPGSGKSTLLRHYQMDGAKLVLENSTEEALSQAPLSFFIPLNDYKTRRADESLPLPRDWLAERWETANRDMPSLETLLRQQRLTLLLDALNEMPHAGADPIRRWKDFLWELARDCPGNRVIFSCRSLDYSASLSSKDLPVPQVRIEPLSDEQVQNFVELYCPEHGPAIWGHLAGSPQLALLRSPYYLRMLVDQSREGEIPEGRAALFTGFVRQAVQREVAGDNPLFRPDELLTARDVQRLTLVRTWRTPYDLPDQYLRDAHTSYDPLLVFSPGGETPEGLVDMIGNTRDWTSSLFQSYPYDAKDGREAPEAEDGRRVVRGGGWLLYRLDARAVFRHVSIPGYRNLDLGLRVLSLAPISEH